MSDDKEKKVKGHLYGEIARLRLHISEMYDEHCTELRTWTWKCGKMGNTIGSLRKQLAEKTELDAQWTQKYDRLQKQLSSKETELQKVIKDLECAQWENLKLKQQLEKKELDDQMVMDKIINEVTALRRLMQETEQEKREEIQHPAELKKVEVEIDSKTISTSIKNETMDLTSDAEEITVENLCEYRDCGQINELEADSIVNAYCSSESGMDEEGKVTGRVDTNVMVKDVPEVSAGNITEPVRHDEDAKQKAKHHFWTTLKKRVSMKGRQVKSVALTSKVSESD